MKCIRKIYDWMGGRVASPHAIVWLFVLFFIESSFFIIPVDPLLILFCVQNRTRSLYYASIATIASVLGGIFGYLIGLLAWDCVGAVLVKCFITEKTFSHLVMQYRLYETWAVLIGGFTPVPYKAITISAGFCKLAFWPFVFYSCIARGARFFLVAGAIYIWGNHIKQLIDDYFNYLVILFALLVIISCSIFSG